MSNFINTDSASIFRGCQTPTLIVSSLTWQGIYINDNFDINQLKQLIKDIYNALPNAQFFVYNLEGIIRIDIPQNELEVKAILENNGFVNLKEDILS